MYINGNRTVQGAVNFCGNDTGSGNSFVASTTGTHLTGLVNGLEATFRASHSNTGPANFNLDGTGAIAIKKWGGAGGLSFLSGGEIPVGALVPLKFDGSFWQIQSGSSSTYIDVTTYGAVGDGVTDSTTAIAAAIAAANAAGGGAVYFPAGVYRTGTQTIYPRVHYLGAGMEASVIKLKDFANADVFRGSVVGYTDGTMCDITRGYTSAGAGLYGTGTSNGAYGWSMRDLTIDGNVEHQNGGDGCGIRVYGYGYAIRDVHVRNCWSHGIYGDYNTSNAFYNPGTATAQTTDTMTIECFIVNCKFDHNGTDTDGGVLNAGSEGVRWAGPTDCMFVNCVSSRNSSHGFHFGPNGGAVLCENCHAWGPALNVGACNYFIEGGDFSSFVNCVSDGSDPTGVGVMVIANGMSWTGGIIFGIPNYPPMQGTGLQLGQAAGTPARPGAVWQNGGVNIVGFASYIRINTVIFYCVNAISFVAEGNNSIEATVFQAPQYQLRDLVCSNGVSSSPVVTSALHYFTSGDVGKTLNMISAFGSWKKGTYQIVSVSGGAATLNAAIGFINALAYGTWTLADLACSNGTSANPVVTSGSYSFQPADVGKLLNITVGTNWIAGESVFYKVLSVTGGAATLSGPCGTVSSLTSASWLLTGAPLPNNWAGTDFVSLQVQGQASDGSRVLGGGNQLSLKSANALNILDGVGGNCLNVNTNAHLLQLLSGSAFEMFKGDFYTNRTYKVDTSGNVLWADGIGGDLDVMLYRAGPKQLAVNGGFCTVNRGVTAATYSCIAADSTIFAATWSNAIAVTLVATPALGQQVTIVKADYTENWVTILGNGKLINGIASQVLTIAWQSVNLQFDGFQWYIVGGYAGSARNPALVTGASYTAGRFDSAVIVDAGGGAVTITLPALPDPNQIISVTKRDGTANAVTVASSANINGASTQSISSQWGSLQMQWAPGPATWYIVAKA